MAFLSIPIGCFLSVFHFGLFADSKSGGSGTKKKEKFRKSGSAGLQELYCTYNIRSPVIILQFTARNNTLLAFGYILQSHPELHLTVLRLANC